MVFQPPVDTQYFICIFTSHEQGQHVDHLVAFATLQDGNLGIDCSHYPQEIVITYWKTKDAMLKFQKLIEETTPKASKYQLQSANAVLGATTTTTTTKKTPPPQQAQKQITPAKKKQKTEHLLTPLDIPPVYDPTSAETNSAGQDAQLSIFEDFAQSLGSEAANERSCATPPKASSVPNKRAIHKRSLSNVIKDDNDTPIVKNLFAGNIKDGATVEVPDEQPPKQPQQDNGIFQYVIEPAPKQNTRSKTAKKGRAREDNDPFARLDKDEKLHYRVAILMAMHSRRANRSEFTSPPPENKIIQTGFLWEHFPECEQILEECASEYFSACYQKLSASDMRKLNDSIVERVQTAIEKYDYEVHREFDERKLRERIRCYYKTLIANAKKRLATLEKHRGSEENRAYINIFMRCALDPTLTLRRSVEMATFGDDFKRRRMSKIEQLRRQVLED